MKKFNPDKELNKIRKGNKNKILYSIITLLLIVAVGSTYALYQVRHTNKIVYTTVDKFINKDIILSVKLDDKDESVNEFPAADLGYVYSHTECEKGNITDITWNEGQRSLNMNSKGPDKCTVYFVKSPFHMKSCENKSISECLLEEGKKFSDYLAFDDPDSNARYMGAAPANYIWFNCDDYSNPTEETCERWRIIGAFNNIEKVNEDGESTTKQNLVKIIRNNPISNIEWDVNNINNWTSASIEQYLNNNYLDFQDNGDWITNTKEKDYKPISLVTKDKIEKIKWNIGGVDPSTQKVNDFYIAERGTKTYNDSWPSTWNGNIGLLYPSDYGYSTSGGNTHSRKQCLEQDLGAWNEEKYKKECADNSWIYTPQFQGTITHNPRNILSFYKINADGSVYTGAVGSTTPTFIRPTLYLTHNTKISGGDGTYENPYQININ